MKKMHLPKNSNTSIWGFSGFIFQKMEKKKVTKTHHVLNIMTSLYFLVKTLLTWLTKGVALEVFCKETANLRNIDLILENFKKKFHSW